MTVVNVKDLQEGDVLKEDLYRGGTLVLKSGTSLTKALISKLKHWDIPSVEIRSAEDEHHVSDQNEQETKVVNNSPDSVPSVSEIKNVFLNNLLKIGHEYRYGFALNDLVDYQWLEGLFIKFMSTRKIYKLLEKLKDWDYDTYQHSFDVFILGTLFAKKLKIDDIEQFAVGCLLHDVGKLEIPKSILDKSSKLSEQEYESVKNHTIYGYRMLKQQDFPEYVANLAKSHHERVEGSGYPDGLKNAEIKEEIKVLAIVDVYSALTMARPYRNAYGSTVAVKMLLKERKMVEDYYFYTFFRMLDIFPLNAIVELTNGIHAKVIDTNDKVPSYPVLEDRYKSNRIKMPLDRSVKIKKIIRF